MRAFSRLYETLDSTTSTLLKIAAMRDYFEHAPPADAAWAVFFLSGRRLTRFIGPSLLREWLGEQGELPPWLVDETHAMIGDLAETIALLMEPHASTTHDSSEPDHALASWMDEALLPLRDLPLDVQKQRICTWWRTLDARRCFLLNKLLTGELRVGVSQGLVERTLAELTGLSRVTIAHRLMGHWSPNEDFWNALTHPDSTAVDHSRPYPFFLASPLEAPVESLGSREDWIAEWKWDGIRAQIVRREGACFIWSRGEELITDRFPEIAAAASSLPEGTVIDGEILAWTEAGVRPFAELQRRIGRKRLTPRILSDIPARFVAYDLLEIERSDVRDQPLAIRRARLLALLDKQSSVLSISNSIAASTWDDLRVLRAQARERSVEGLMLKALSSSYGTGRQRGAWWKWKIEPYSFDGVLIYAQPGHGRRSNLYTDYTFGVWQGEQLLPVAKAYSGLSDVEIVRLDRWIRQHMLEKFGPVRAVQPELVFEIAFEAIQVSTRHKSGIALRFPRIARWREDKLAKDADTLDSLKALINARSEP